MLLGRVTGTVVSTVKHAAYEGQKLLLVEPIDEGGTRIGDELIAVDRAQAGPGDLVLVLQEGNGVRQIFRRDEALENPPILQTIVAIVDSIRGAT
jgi:ethanolamine utilization protein EutN